MPWYAILPGYWNFLEFLDGFGGKERHGCVCHVGELHNGAEVSGKVIEYVYENLSFLVRGVEQVSGKSEGWTWVDDTRFCVPEAK